MNNHYHLLAETGTPTLSRGMKLLNGSYTQWFNRRHLRVGHLFQGRFQAILLEREKVICWNYPAMSFFNPVRARMVRSAAEWKCSSYRATAGLAANESLLTNDWILSCFPDKKKPAQDTYRRFVQEGKKQTSLWENLKNQIYLGCDEFVEEMQCQLDPEQSLKDIPRKQKQAPPRPLSDFRQMFGDCKEAMARAYPGGHYTLEPVGQSFGVSYTTVSRAVKHCEAECKM